jgi:hypothetical protein
MSCDEAEQRFRALGHGMGWNVSGWVSGGHAVDDREARLDGGSVAAVERA